MKLKYKNIVFWQEQPSPHQAPWIRLLADIIPGCRVVCVFQKELAQNRIDLGWQHPDYGKACVLISPDKLSVEQLIVNESSETIHVFSGLVRNHERYDVFKKAVSTNALVGILSEGRDWRGWKGLLRCGHAFLNERSYKRSVNFVLAIGRVGVRWYSLCGYSSDKIYPFAYVVDKCSDNKKIVYDKKQVNLVFVGRLIPLKRLDLLLKALADISVTNWRLQVIGDGIQYNYLVHLAKRLGIASRVIFRGALKNSLARQVIEGSDVMIFTSRADGWGAVVNEALMAGVPVLCSDYCGAADLIVRGFNGELFRCDSQVSLTHVLSEWINNGPMLESKRLQIIDWSRCIEGITVAKYFLDILLYLQGDLELRPTAPWIINNMELNSYYAHCN